MNLHVLDSAYRPDPHALATAVLLLAAAFSMPAQAMRCDGRITHPGDHLVQVREICGDPFWVDQYSEVLVVGEGGLLEQQREQLIEIWYYNFGAKRLMQRLVFLDTRLQREDDLDYGFDRSPDGCNPDRLPLGISNGEVVARCGLPLDRRRFRAETIARDGYGNARAGTPRREEWVYRVGRSNKSSLLHMVDGQLVQVQRLR